MNNFVEHRESYFSKYYDLMPFRFPTFKIALNLLIQRTSSQRVIFETGTQSMNDWAAGCSTSLFAEFCLYYGGEVHSVDSNKIAIQKAREITKRFEDFITYYEDDSIKAINNFQRKIDLIYLDSFDYPIGIKNKEIVLVGDPVPSQQHILKEITAALPMLANESIILIDDSNCIGGGKGALAVPFLESQGWIVVYDNQQTVLIHR